MTKYALLFYRDEGIHYYIEMNGATEEEALQSALEYISGGDLFEDGGDLRFEIIEVGKKTKYNTSQHQHNKLNLLTATLIRVIIDL